MNRIILMLTLFVSVGMRQMFSQKLFDKFLLSDEDSPHYSVSEVDMGGTSMSNLLSPVSDKFSEDGKNEIAKEDVEQLNKVTSSFSGQLQNSISAYSNTIEGSVMLLDELDQFVMNNGFTKMNTPILNGVDYFVGKRSRGVVGQMIMVSYLPEGKVFIISMEGGISFDLAKVQSMFK